MFSRFIFWPWFAGLVFLVIGLFAVRREVVAAPGLEKLIVLGRVFYAVPLAVFGAEHLSGARFLVPLVPAFMPVRLFWAYFVGFALIAAALSILSMRYVRSSATLAGVMFCGFVLLIHLPNVVTKPGDRIFWAIALRDLAFAGGAWALAGTQTKEWRTHGSSGLATVARFLVGVPIVFFAVEHFLHPEFAPGVPLPKVTPSWIPLAPLWGYLTGAVLLAAGVAVLVKKKARAAASWLGLVLTLVVVFIYLPIYARATQPSEMNEGLNYVADTLLFAGTVLLLAGAMPMEKAPQ